MRAFNWLLTLLFLVGCKESTQPRNAPQKPSEAPTETPVTHLKEEHVAADFAFIDCNNLTIVAFLGDAPNIENDAFEGSSPTIYRKADAKGWGDTLAGRPVKLITEKP